MPDKDTHCHLTEAEWLTELNDVRSEVSIPGYWDVIGTNCQNWAKEVSANPFWASAKEQLTQWISEYRSMTGGPLLARPGLPDFNPKDVNRIRSKMYQERKKNNAYKGLPVDGPPVPILNDLVRTRISCLFIDGVEFLASKLFQLANTMGLNPIHSREGRLEGYFAQHLNFKLDVFYRFGGVNKPTQINCEIQLATELSTRIWEATHIFYEESRESKEISFEWQWNPKDPLFVSHQLGHMIHLADGLLVQLREAMPLKK